MKYETLKELSKNEFKNTKECILKECDELQKVFSLIDWDNKYIKYVNRLDSQFFQKFFNELNYCFNKKILDYLNISFSYFNDMDILNKDYKNNIYTIDDDFLIKLENSFNKLSDLIEKSFKNSLTNNSEHKRCYTLVEKIQYNEKKLSIKFISEKCGITKKILENYLIYIFNIENFFNSKIEDIKQVIEIKTFSSNQNTEIIFNNIESYNLFVEEYNKLANM